MRFAILFILPCIPTLSCYGQTAEKYGAEDSRNGGSDKSSAHRQ